MSAREHPQNLWLRALPWAFGVVAFAIAAKKLIGGYGDLGIYLDVAREFQQGGIDIYRARENSGPWAYPHFAALPFVLLLQFGGDAAARWIYCVLLGVGVAIILGDVVRAMRPFGGLRWWQWVAFGVLFQRCLAQNSTHGQLSLFVAMLVTRGVLELQRGRDGRAGIALGIAAALKLTPVLFLVALVPMKRPRAALSMLLCIVVTVFLVPWPFCGTDEHFRHLNNLWQTIAGSLVDPDAVPLLEYYCGPSVRGTLDYLLQPRPIDPEGRTTNLVHIGDGALMVAKILWSGLIAAVLGLWFLRARKLPEMQRLTMQAAVVMFAMSLFSPSLRLYHLSAAVLGFALFCRGPSGRRDVLWWTTSAALLFTMTLRQKNLLGETLWRALDVGGLLHFALVAIVVWLCRDTYRTRPPAP